MSLRATPESDEPSQRPEFARLAGYLELLANPARLELLHMLRHPLTANEIQLEPTAPGGFQQDRSMTEQAVRKHLAKLKEAGLAIGQRVRRNGLTVEEHVVNHAMLFVIMEELRKVTRITPTVAIAPAQTMTGGGKAGPGAQAGPRLLVLHGPREGEAIRLTLENQSPGRGWVVGRKPGVAASLDYDLFLSQEHAEILMKGDRFELLDLRTNKNGTRINWTEVPRGGTVQLANGDVISLGRTSLLFRDR